MPDRVYDPTHVPAACPVCRSYELAEARRSAPRQVYRVTYAELAERYGDMAAVNAANCPGRCPWLGETIDGRMSCAVHDKIRPMNPAELAAKQKDAEARMFKKVDAERREKLMAAKKHFLALEEFG